MNKNCCRKITRKIKRKFRKLRNFELLEIFYYQIEAYKLQKPILLAWA